MTAKEQFQSLLTGITRNGIENLAAFLEQSDFYKAPASTKYHLAEPGGLLIHSLHVHMLLNAKVKMFKLTIPQETILICSLFHDICKANFYGTENRNVKNDATGQWEKKQIYVVKDQFPMGHGEKSVTLLLQYVHLTEEEMLAIRWHMGAWTEGMTEYGMRQAYNEAKKRYPLVTLLATADMEASQVLEVEKEEN